MRPKKIFIFEFVAGGGFNKETIPSSLFCEGFSMLRTILDDFKETELELLTTLDNRISFLRDLISVDEIRDVFQEDDYEKIYTKMVRESDFVLVIAPEFSDILLNLIKIVKNEGKISLNMSLEGIQIASSKNSTFNWFKENNIKQPDTFIIPYKNDTLDQTFIREKFKQLNKSIIIKPDDGVGAELIYLIETEKQLKDFIQVNLESLEKTRDYVLQEFIPGDNLSISLYNDNNLDKPIILSANSQDIKLGKDSTSEYFGGHTPIKNLDAIKKTIEEEIQKFDANLFNGYFGVDLIKSRDGTFYFIEINPRLTTSYIGISKLANVSIASLLLSSWVKGQELEPFQIKGNSAFSRIELRVDGNDLDDIKIEEEVLPSLLEEIPEFITPPIAFNESGQERKKKRSCFVATREKDLKSSELRIQEIKKILQNYGFKSLN